MDYSISLGPVLYQLKQRGLVEDGRKEGGFTLTVTAEDLSSLVSLLFPPDHSLETTVCGCVCV